MGKRKNKGNFKKNHEEVAEYKRFLANSTISPESTVPLENEMLRSSKELVNEEDSSNQDVPIKPKPARYKFFDWIKDNIFAAIITSIVLAASGLVIRHMVDLAVLNQRVSALEQQVESLVKDSATKEMMSLQLEKLEESINSNFTTSTGDIKIKLSEIEFEIEILRNSIEKSEKEVND